MTEAFLEKLRKESMKAIYSYKINHKIDSEIPKEIENAIMLSIYARHIGEIDEEDTNEIYYYDGTYKYVYDSWLEAYGLGPVEERVARDDPSANFRRYSNVEGIYSHTAGIKVADEFERTHTIIYLPEADIEDNSLYRISHDFVIFAIKEGQEKARKLLLNKYNTNRE